MSPATDRRKLKFVLTIQRRHTSDCPDAARGPNFVKCRGCCPLQVSGTEDGRRIRLSLGTRDYHRATKKLAKLEAGEMKAPKLISAAIADFLESHKRNSESTLRKYRLNLSYLQRICDAQNISFVCDVAPEVLDDYAALRGKENWTYIKEVEFLRQFFKFCVDRDWIAKNPARNLDRPKLLEANNIVPYSQQEIIRIFAACGQIGRSSYEKLRARAMTMLMRFAALRISDVATFSREHLQGQYVVKRAVKNGKLIRVLLPPVAIEALAAVPHPRDAERECRLYFATGNAKVSSVCTAIDRTMGAVFKKAGVAKGHCHRFRHTLASEMLAKGATFEDIAAVLADAPDTVRRHYAKWTPGYQDRQDALLQRVHGEEFGRTDPDRRPS